jgi:hypothetical protein
MGVNFPFFSNIWQGFGAKVITKKKSFANTMNDQILYQDPHCKEQCQKSETIIPRNGIAQPQSQFPQFIGL